MLQGYGEGACAPWWVQPSPLCTFAQAGKVAPPSGACALFLGQPPMSCAMLLCEYATLRYFCHNAHFTEACA